MIDSVNKDEQINSLGDCIDTQLLTDPRCENCSDNNTGTKEAPVKKYAPTSVKRAGKKGRTWRRGGPVNYFSYHYRIRKARGRPQFCEHCKTTDPAKVYHWANLTGHYEDMADYIRLCVSCHGLHDKGKITRQDIETIKARCLAGERQGDIARDFGIDRSTVSRINSGKRR